MTPTDTNPPLDYVPPSDDTKPAPKPLSQAIAGGLITLIIVLALYGGASIISGIITGVAS